MRPWLVRVVVKPRRKKVARVAVETLVAVEVLMEMLAVARQEAMVCRLVAVEIKELAMVQSMLVKQVTAVAGVQGILEV